MAADPPTPPLTLPPDQMRRLGYQVVDLVVDALAGLRDRPPSRRAGPQELAGLLNEPVPRAGADPEEVLRQAVAGVLGPAMRVDHPRFFAYVPIPSNYVGMGTTSTGSVDPLAELASLCQAEGLWFHVDGAFGAPAILSAGGRELLAGIEQADSLALDAAAGDREVNFTDRGLQLTRSFRAFKLWLSLKVFGLDAFAAAVQHGMELAGYADALLRRRPGWEVVTPTRLARVEELAAGG